MKRRCFAVVFAALVVLSACDHAPVDPLDPRADLTSLLASDDAAPDGTSMLALPGLVQAAVRKVYAEQGIAAAAALVEPLRRLHEEVQAERAGDSAGAGDALERLHAEEIRILLHVFGDALAGRVLAAVRSDAVLLADTVAGLESTGRRVPRAGASLARVDALLQEGDAFLAQGDAPAALGAAGRAAKEADAIRRSFAEASRLPTVGVMFEEAVDRLRASDTYTAEREIEKYRAVEAAAQVAIRNGNRDQAHAAVDVVRREQIQLVLSILGPAAAERTVRAAEQARVATEADLARAAAAGRDVFRLDRMLKVARDLNGRADRAFRRGDAATALDLGSHAADLIDTVRLALIKS
jgi:hypothetical protein